MLSVEVGHQLSLLRLLESDGFETQVCFGWVQASDQVCGPLDFRRRYGTEWMGRDLFGWCCHWAIGYLFCRHDGDAFHREGSMGQDIMQSIYYYLSAEKTMQNIFDYQVEREMAVAFLFNF